MKYQVGFSLVLQGEMSVEADTPEDAKEMVKDELMFISIDDADADTTELWIDDPYEWDEAAQKRNSEEVKEILKKFPLKDSFND
jgi:hypothetical protein